MRILLFQSWLGGGGVADQLVFPLGLACIASALERAGHEARIVDLNVGPREPGPRVEREIADWQPDAVGVSLRNIDSTTRKAPFVFHGFLRPVLDAIRRAAPHSPAIIGGPGFTQGARTFMSRHPFDFGIQAEGEGSLPELLENMDRPAAVAGAWWRDSGGRVRDPSPARAPDFTSLPFPRRHHVDWDLYRQEARKRGLALDIGVETTRGCPRRCAYCNYPFLNGRHLRKKPPEVVADEVEYLQETFGVDSFTFTDSRFNEDPLHARQVCEALIQRRLKVSWVAWLGFTGLDTCSLELMWEAGCRRVAFSPDGLLQPSLDRMRKDTTTREITASVEAVRRVKGLKASWSFFATPPSTSRREQVALLTLYGLIHGSLPGRGRMTLSWCRVEEGTHFETIAREDGVLPEGVDLLPEDPALLDRLYYIPPGFHGWSRFWDRFLDLEIGARAGLGRLTQPLRRFGVKDLTPPHLRAEEHPHHG